MAKLVDLVSKYTINKWHIVLHQLLYQSRGLSFLEIRNCCHAKYRWINVCNGVKNADLCQFFFGAALWKKLFHDLHGQVFYVLPRNLVNAAVQGNGCEGKAFRHCEIIFGSVCRVGADTCVKAQNVGTSGISHCKNTLCVKVEASCTLHHPFAHQIQVF